MKLKKSWKMTKQWCNIGNNNIIKTIIIAATTTLTLKSIYIYIYIYILYIYYIYIHIYKKREQIIDDLRLM